MKCKRIHYSRHAFERMFERAIPPDTIERVIAQGEVIMNYPDERPYPSLLMLGFDGVRPIHLVLAHNATTEECHIITVYLPDTTLWDETFKRRRKP